MEREPFNPNLIRVPPAEQPQRRGPLTVSQVTTLVKQAIESELPATIHVVGEISNLNRHSSGHVYLTLKDRFSELSCVMWRSAAAKLRFTPTDGMEVIASGTIEVFERAGRYQLYIRKLEPRGIGALELAFRQLCEKLSQEGLFKEERKRPLPPYPQRIAVLTSPTGAAIADMIRTIERRYPCVEVLLYPVRVQGPGAANEIAAAIRSVNANRSALGGVDLMIVGRGGGSLEDLWAFNEEVVARAIFTSRIPIISAVGHEVDVTLADLVADLRAATPTAAAELAVPVLDDVLENLRELAARLVRGMRGKVELLSLRMSAVLQRAAFREPLHPVHRREQLVDELSGRMHRSIVQRVHAGRRKVDDLEPIMQRVAPHAHLLQKTVALRDAAHRLRWVVAQRIMATERTVDRCAVRLERASPANTLPRLADRWDRFARALSAAVRHCVALEQERLRRQEELLAAMSYKSVLGRGFSLTRTKRGRTLVRSLRQLADRQRIVTEVADGEIESEVVNLNQLELFE